LTSAVPVPVFRGILWDAPGTRLPVFRHSFFYLEPHPSSTRPPPPDWGGMLSLHRQSRIVLSWSWLARLTITIWLHFFLCVMMPRPIYDQLLLYPRLGVFLRFHPFPMSGCSSFPSFLGFDLKLFFFSFRGAGAHSRFFLSCLSRLIVNYNT